MRDELKEIFRNVLDLDSVPDDASTTTVASWDSVRHLSLILAIEERFDVSFDADEIPELTSFAALERRLAGGAGPRPAAAAQAASDKSGESPDSRSTIQT